MPGLIAILAVAIPVVELLLILKVAETIGILQTIALLIALAVAGVWLLLHQGISTWRALRAAIARGEVPATELIDAALLLVAGGLLLIPGFFTDAIALVFLLPASRAVTRRGLRRSFGWLVAGRFGAAGVAGKGIYDASVTRVRRRGEVPSLVEPPPPLPSEERPHAADDSSPLNADDSRDRG